MKTGYELRPHEQFKVHYKIKRITVNNELWCHDVILQNNIMMLLATLFAQTPLIYDYQFNCLCHPPSVLKKYHPEAQRKTELYISFLLLISLNKNTSFLWNFFSPPTNESPHKLCTFALFLHDAKVSPTLLAVNFPEQKLTISLKVKLFSFSPPTKAAPHPTLPSSLISYECDWSYCWPPLLHVMSPCSNKSINWPHSLPHQQP